jgi:hypothetical protein
VHAAGERRAGGGLSRSGSRWGAGAGRRAAWSLDRGGGARVCCALLAAFGTFGRRRLSGRRIRLVEANLLEARSATLPTSRLPSAVWPRLPMTMSRADCWEANAASSLAGDPMSTCPSPMTLFSRAGRPPFSPSAPRLLRRRAASNSVVSETRSSGYTATGGSMTRARVTESPSRRARRTALRTAFMAAGEKSVAARIFITADGAAAMPIRNREAARDFAGARSPSRKRGPVRVLGPPRSCCGLPVTGAQVLRDLISVVPRASYPDAQEPSWYGVCLAGGLTTRRSR